jgi:non-ribosomal peptide synthetase component E (peptide arylation enzyme)
MDRVGVTGQPVPRAVYIKETLPKKAVGKIAKPVLRERLRQQDPAKGTHA